MTATNALIGRLARRFCRRAMTFTEPAGPITLPPPADQPYLLYLHIPYCVTLCPFCSFHRVRFDEPAARSYHDYLRTEISRVSEQRYVFDELYVGGGTPTVLPDELFATIDLVRKTQPITSISVETNPDDLAKESVQRLRDGGVDRLSVGVQSFDDKLLAEMQRLDKYGNGREIRERLRSTTGAFQTLNVDMIFNFPHQDEASIRRDLDILIDDVGADQVSWYPLMPANGTRVSMQSKMGDVDYTREKDFYELIATRFLDAGYVRNSAWCFSREPGMADEYIADRENYVGLGSGAFSYVAGSLYASTFSIPDYVDRVGAGGTGTVRRRQLGEREQMRYYLLMQLFRGWLDLDTAEARFHGHFETSLRREITAFQFVGAIERSGRRIELTNYGFYVWVMLMREFFTAINNLRDEMRSGAY